MGGYWAWVLLVGDKGLGLGSLLLPKQIVIG